MILNSITKKVVFYSQPLFCIDLIIVQIYANGQEPLAQGEVVGISFVVTDEDIPPILVAEINFWDDFDSHEGHITSSKFSFTL